MLVLGLGMARAPTGSGWLHFDDYELAAPVGIIALALILFEGGLASGWPEIRPVLAPGVQPGVVGTTDDRGHRGFGAAWLLDLSLLEGLLLGAIVVATDGAAIFAMLRGSTLRRRLARTLEGEAGFNDPVAVLLVLGFIAWITSRTTTSLDMAGVRERAGIGARRRPRGRRLAVRLLRRVRLATGGLYPVASLAFAAIAFGGGDVLHGSGFLVGLPRRARLGARRCPARGDGDLPRRPRLGRPARMFLVLGLLVFPVGPRRRSRRGRRPRAHRSCSSRGRWRRWSRRRAQGFALRERVVLGWAGLRGAVPVVLATFPVIEGVPGSEEFFDIAFFAVLVSTCCRARRSRARAAAGGDDRRGGAAGARPVAQARRWGAAEPVRRPRKEDQRGWLSAAVGRCARRRPASAPPRAARAGHHERPA